MAINQLYLIKSGENSFVEETGVIISISGERVGMGTNIPESFLHITGNTQIDGDLTVKGNFSTVNETTVQIDDKNIELGVGSNSDMLSDGGGITLKGFTDKTITWLQYNEAWNFNTNVYIDGSGNFASGVNVDGDVTIGSDFNVGGSGNFASGVNVDGDVTVGSDFNVGGSGNFASGVNVDGDVTVGSDFNVGGSGNFASGVNVDGDVTVGSDFNVGGSGNFASGVNVDGDVTVGSDFNVGGSGNFASGVNVDGDVTVGSDFNVGGSGNFASGVNVDGDVTVGSDFNVGGSGNFASGVNVDGDVTVGSDFNVGGSGNFASGVNVDGDVTVGSDFNVGGSGNFASGVNVDGDVTVGSDFNVGGSGNFASGVYLSNQPVLTGVREDLSKWSSVYKDSDKTFSVDISGDGGDYNFYGDINGKDPEITVFIGDSLIFNNIGEGHLLEIKDSDGNVISSELDKQTTFNAHSEGRYSYYCTSHPNSMSGILNVSRYKEIYFNGGAVGIGTNNPNYKFDVIGQGHFSDDLFVGGNPVLTGNNFDDGLFVSGNPVLTGTVEDLGKWEDGGAGKIYYTDGFVGVSNDSPSFDLHVSGDAKIENSLKIGSVFDLNQNGNLSNNTPSIGDAIKWDGSKWIPGFVSSSGGGEGGASAPPSFITNLASGQSVQTISFGQTFPSAPGISTDLETNSEGGIIPYIISGVSTTGYYAVFTAPIPNDHYRMHTVFGGTSSDVGKWEDAVDAGEIYYNEGNVGIGTSDPAYSLHVNGTIHNENGGINVGNKFNVSTLGAVGGQSPDFNQVIKWDGSKWIAGSAPGGGASLSSEVPSSFDTWLNQGSAIQAISFVDAPEGGYQSIPSISTDVEIIDGDIIPYAISGVSTTGYYAVFSDPIPTANNYKIHTTFGGKEVYWQTGAGGNSIYYNGDSVSVDDLIVGGNLTVNGTTTTINTQTVEIEDHNLVIAANTGYNQLTAEYPGADGAYAGILWGTGDAGAASPVSLTYQSNKGFAFEGGYVGIGATNPSLKLEVQDENQTVALFKSQSTATNAVTAIAIESPSATSNGRTRIGADVDDLTFSTSNGASSPHTSIERMRIDTNGNVGIGTTNPVTPLTVRSSALSSTDSAFSIVSAANSAEPIIKIAEKSTEGCRLHMYDGGVEKIALYTDGTNNFINAGNVGIGTTDPDFNLSVVSDTDPAKIGIHGYGDFSDGTVAAQLLFLGRDSDENPRNLAHIQVREHAHPSGTGSMEFWTRKGGNEAARMTIDSDGNVGIGTTAPDANLHIEVDSGPIDSGNNRSGAVLRLAHNAEWNSAYNDGGSNPDFLGGIEFETGDASSGTGVRAAIKTTVDHYANVNSLAFYTAPGGSSPIEERLRIDSAGNVGIGTTNPSSALHVVQSGDANDGITIQQANQSGKVNLRTNTTGQLIFDVGDATVEAMRIDTDGNVGIGTTSPARNLSVAGNFRIEKTAVDNGHIGLDFNVGGGADHPELNIYDKDGNAGVFTIKDKNVGIGTTSPSAKLEIGQSNGTNGLTLNYIPTTYPNRYKSDLYHDGAGNLKIESWAGSATTAGNILLAPNGGSVGIGTTNPGTYKLYVNGEAFFANTIRVTATDYDSDDRVKHNEQPIVGALETLSKITPKKYIKTTEMYDANHDFELDESGNPVDADGQPVEHRIEAGVIAQQVLTVDELAFAVSPEGVDEDGVVTSPHGLDYNSLFTYAIAAIQEQQQLIDDLKSQKESQQSTIDSLVSRINNLENK